MFNKLKRRKAAGPDLVTYEHLIFGGDLLNICLVKLFISIGYIGNIPGFWKRGFNVPLYKGKLKTNPRRLAIATGQLLSCHVY